MPASNVNERFEADPCRVTKRRTDNPLPLGDALEIHADILRFGCPGYGSEVRVGAIAEGLAALLEDALDRRNAPDALDAARNKVKITQVLNLIGNVDHSIGNGANAAKARGDILNTIRSIFES